LEACTSVEMANGEIKDIAALRPQIDQQFEALSCEGLRTLGIACREMGKTDRVMKAQEADMTFLGFLLFEDPLRPNIAEIIQQLHSLGISLKVITGDNHLVAASISKQAGMKNPH